MKVNRVLLIILGFVTLFAVVMISPLRGPLVSRMQGKKTVEDRLAQYGPAARMRMAPAFKNAGIEYPPKQIILVGLKNERVMRVFASSDSSGLRFIKTYPIKAISGTVGPKLKEGDCQSPEGIYRITFLNPNSLYHLSMRLNYPNGFDCAMAKKDGRTNLGKDIMIHGDEVSIGCIAVGDEAAEDLFVLAADTGIQNAKVILSPVDFRKTSLPTVRKPLPLWTHQLYRSIASELKQLPD